MVAPESSSRLGGIRQKGTAPEQQMGKLLRTLGFSFEMNSRDLPGSPDIANRRERWGVFVHGCYWHAHQGCPRATVPKRNREFWLAKFASNRARDQRALRSLRKLGYRALVVWECQLHASPEKVRRRLSRLLGARHRSLSEQMPSVPRARHLSDGVTRRQERVTQATGLMSSSKERREERYFHGMRRTQGHG
jgi:DNA mismatch endonuclease (patch repair protein)